MTATTTARAQGVEYHGGDLAWVPYGEEGAFYREDGTVLDFPTADEAWAWVDQHNAPA